MDFKSPYLTEQIITYLGNKRSLLPFIDSAINIVREKLNVTKLDGAFDVFAGSGIVSRYLKQISARLFLCDIERYSKAINDCYLANVGGINKEAVERAVALVNRLAQKSPRPGFISELYAPHDDENIRHGERVFYTRRNALFIDTARALIDEEVAPDLRPFVLGPLLYRASVHANTSGVFKGFYKNQTTGIGQFGGTGRNALKRICEPFTISSPVWSPAENLTTFFLGDALAAARAAPPVDLAYLDPPYNQHPYGSNYFMLNLITENRRPEEMSKVSGIPADWNRSTFNNRSAAKISFRELTRTIKAKFLLVSFNSEGFITYDEMLGILSEIGNVQTLATSYNTFRGSRNLRNRAAHVTEYLFLVEKE